MSILKISHILAFFVFLSQLGSGAEKLNVILILSDDREENRSDPHFARDQTICIQSFIREIRRT